MSKRGKPIGVLGIWNGLGFAIQGHDQSVPFIDQERVFAPKTEVDTGARSEESAFLQSFNQEGVP